MRWCRPFEYVDGLDIEPLNPCASPVTQAAWAVSRKRRERERVRHGLEEHFRIEMTEKEARMLVSLGRSGRIVQT